MIDDLTKLAEPNNIILDSENLISKTFLTLDPQVLYRILENLIGNASRFAKSKISLSFQYIVLESPPAFFEFQVPLNY